MSTRRIRFGIIGGGLMGKEFASAIGRWCHLLNVPARPELVAICNRVPASHAWYREHFPTIKQFTEDYRALLANPDVDAVYIAVPHHLHAEMYCAAIEAGKHLLGEKPFGIDRAAAQLILDACKAHPKVLVRCASEFPFFPAVQRIGALIEANAFGQIIEVNAGFLHSSDLDPKKPINWKRMIEFNGEYGVMGDLGMHVCHVPFRAGWRPVNVRAILSDIVKQRFDATGKLVPCKTWDNATLVCETADPVTGEHFPMTLKTQRIAPGQKNTWQLEILGTQTSARWSSANPKILERLDYTGGEQIWQNVQTGYDTAFKTVTGAIFEFGFTDSILQMWAAYVHELATGKPISRFAGCATPEEASISHSLFTAALRSHARQSVETV